MRSLYVAEVFKHGGHHLIHRLHQFIHGAWTTGKLPQQWKDATIVTCNRLQKERGQTSLWQQSWHFLAVGG